MKTLRLKVMQFQKSQEKKSSYDKIAAMVDGWVMLVFSKQLMV